MIPIVLGVVFGVGWLLIFAFRAESMGDALPYYSARERFWVRAAPLVLGLHVTLACGYVSTLPAVPRLRGIVGIAVYVAALLFWLRARAQIGPLHRRPLPDDAPPTLRRDGPFGLVRNPLYLAYLVAGAAPAIVAARPILALTWLASFAALAVRAAQEERRLHAQLGPAYAAYCREVKSLIPFLW